MDYVPCKWWDEYENNITAWKEMQVDEQVKRFSEVEFDIGNAHLQLKDMRVIEKMLKTIKR